ncbi:C40 family peptidase [Levilactobacillus angrenensis]|uniref:C40 family peptidase n=1 Tax=Levilactobacillus angrenensis TaxID=2486020 RepID=A0ABW1UCJ6_9LACO|nr:C40 family peptidase [Levilactobacillus angrenensis]
MTFIKTQTRFLISTLAAGALFLAGTSTTASAHMATSQQPAQTQTTATTNTAATTTPATNTSYQHTTTTPTTSTSTSTSTTNTGSQVAGGNGVATALAIANSGTPYVYGGNTTAGFDCSGLVQYALGLSARTTTQQATLGTHHYDVANAPAGAILFWGSESNPYHDGLSLGNGSYVAAQNPTDGIGVFSQTYFTPSFYVIP